MRFNQYFKIGEHITIAVPDTVNNIKTWIYVPGLNKEKISNNIEVKNGFKFITIPNVDKDSYILFKGDDISEIAVVGYPPTALIIHFNNLNKVPLKAKQFNYNGELIYSSNFTPIGDNFYTVLNVSLNKSFYKVFNRYISATHPDKLIANSIGLNGEIRLQRGNWQLISIPIEGKVKEHFLDKLSQQENKPIADLVEIVASYPGHVNKFLSYIPIVNDENDEENFDLMYEDQGSNEILGFWVKCKKWDHTTNDIVFKWNN